MKFSLNVLLVLMTCFVLNTAFGQDLTIPKKNYTDSIDFTKRPNRLNDKYPLFDQQNATKWSLVKALSDEFDGKTLDTQKWFPNNPKWKGREPTFFHASNTTVKNGLLVMKLNQHGSEVLPEGFTHTSGFIVSKQPFLYGYIEAELKPLNAHWVTGFWMSNHEKDWWTEIDICENAPGVKGNEHDLNSNVHIFKSPENEGNVKKHFSIGKKYHIPFELQKDYHVWGLEWTEKVIRFYLDGVLFREQENTHWHQPLFININCESNKWFGALPDDAGIKEQYEVKYVRVWEKK